jgi:hypothetical protein
MRQHKQQFEAIQGNPSKNLKQIKRDFWGRIAAENAEMRQKGSLFCHPEALLLREGSPGIFQSSLPFHGSLAHAVQFPTACANGDSIPFTSWPAAPVFSISELPAISSIASISTKPASISSSVSTVPARRDG